MLDRQILHLRVPAFPVAIYQVKDPSLRGRPVIVSAGRGPRAVVLSASPQAGREGVRRGMALHDALRRCRTARVLPPDPVLFDRADRALAGILARFSPLIEPRRGGRLFADLTGTGRLLGKAPDVARAAQKEIERTLRLGPNAGLGTNMLISGVAARLLRPVSLLDVERGREADFLSPLPVGHLPAVGAQEEGRLLDELNIRTVSDLAAIDLPHLRAVFGERGGLLYRQARGIDPTPVRPPERTPAAEADETLAEDTHDDALLAARARELLERCAARVRAMGMAAGRLHVTARYSDGTMASRRTALSPPLPGDLSLFARMEETLGAATRRRGRVRYLRVRLDRLSPAFRQGLLFGEGEMAAARGGQPAAGPRGEPELTAALDRIRGRFGGGSIGFGRGRKEERAAGAA
ncbi:MAG TPA: hypothetical protein VJV23_02560 [Candidatus Polarisedimenticolia bacterium]|nr:hypothetical protein [Candidatus Polarisedimenticolia bacterium]